MYNLTNNFVHLHVHSEYSLLDGACRIKDLVRKAKDLGFKSIAVTDHGNMYGAIEFYKEAKSNGIKPIIGCEVYVAARNRRDKVHEFDGNNSHLILLCKNKEGYQNLIKMVSISFIEGFYKKPRIDYELLKKYHEGLIALSACLAGEIPKALILNDYALAKQKAINLERIFGKDNFYLEMQDHDLEEQKRILPLIKKLSEETNIPLVATNDCHYIGKEDNEMHKVLLCIQTNHTLEEENAMEFGSKEFYVKSANEMIKKFAEYPEAIKNTVHIAEKCNLDFEFGNTKLPHFEVPDNKDHFLYFREQCYIGLYEKYGNRPDKSIVDRLEYELNTIKNMGYVDYYLIVHDFVRYAKSQGIPVGPGRGSGAGSIVAFCMGITSIDPIRYNLLFERFLNPERISMPDFDIDFCYERRQEVIDYVIEKYGTSHVAQIITFGTMAAKLAIRDVGRVMMIPYAEVDSIVKLIPNELNVTINKGLQVSLELRDKYASSPKIKYLIDMAQKVEGMPRQASTHAAGVVITKEPVDHYVPLAKNNDAVVTQYTMTTLEELGLLKMDFLGLRTLTVLSYAEKMVKRTNPKFSIGKIPENDKKVFEMLSAGNTSGVFQFESQGMTNVLMRLKSESIEDLIAVISLYRPGPMDSISRYIENRHNPEKIRYLHPSLSNILDVTYGCIVYQEQVMQIFRMLAGYSLGRADLVRRAMSKKKVEVMEKEKDIFINGLTDVAGKIQVEGCLRRGIDKETAENIFKEMQNFALYAFNKSHAAAYAFISYQTAYMKCYYPKEYMAALLTSVLDDSNKVAMYIEECTKLNIKVLPPHVNKSESGFTVFEDTIRFGLLAVKGIGKSFISKLLENIECEGKFRSFYDFCKRMYANDLNKRIMENLIKCGALDNLGANRNQMLKVYQSVLDGLYNENKRNIEGQLDFFNMLGNQEDNKLELPQVPELESRELLMMEKEVTGMYFSGHPLLAYKKMVNNKNFNRISDIIFGNSIGSSYKDGNLVNILCIVTNVVLKSTRSDSVMAFVQIEDMTGSIEMLVFPKVLEKSSFLLKEGNVLVVKSKINLRENEVPKLICEEIQLPNNASKQTSKTRRPGLYLKVPNSSCVEYDRLMLIADIFNGETPLYIFFTDEKKLVRAPIGKWVYINEPMIKELKKVLGEKNVVLQE